jgi:hypothetical protein
MRFYSSRHRAKDAISRCVESRAAIMGSGRSIAMSVSLRVPPLEEGDGFTEIWIVIK